MERFPTIAPANMTAEQRAIVDAIASGPRGGLRGPFPALLHNPPLCQHVQVLGEHLRFKTKLPNALLELAVIITARRWSAQYEWFAHARLARNAGLNPAIIDAIAAGKVPASMSEDEALVHGFVTQLFEKGSPDDTMFARCKARFGLDGTLDLIGLCGYYSMVAMLLNTAKVPVPDGTTPLPPIPA